LASARGTRFLPHTLRMRPAARAARAGLLVARRRPATAAATPPGAAGAPPHASPSARPPHPTPLDGTCTTVSMNDKEKKQDVSPGLYVVATPIGNLDDLSPRAARTLCGAALVLCEDTRTSAPLLARAVAAAGVDRAPPTLSLHSRNEGGRIEAVLAALARGEAVALISDAGTPGVSDPGASLAAAAAAAGHAVVPIPGPCAAAAAVSACGLECGDWLFAGFLPPRSAARRARFASLASLPAALVAYCPGRATADVLADAAAALGGGRRVAVAREMTKLHEEWTRGPLAAVAAAYAARGDIKGEVTLVIERPPRPPPGARGGSGAAVDARSALASLLADGVPASAAARALAAALGVPRSPLYAEAVRLSEGRGGEGGG